MRWLALQINIWLNMSDEKRKRGGQSTYTVEMADEICAWIAEGKTLREFCRQDGRPSFSAVYDWMALHEDFRERIARARESGEDQIAQECLQIANTPQLGEIITQKADGGSEIRMEDMLGHRKLQIDTRLKLLAKWNPKKYGDKVENYISGPAGGPIQAAITVQFVKTGESEQRND